MSKACSGGSGSSAADGLRSNRLLSSEDPDPPAAGSAAADADDDGIELF